MNLKSISKRQRKPTHPGGIIKREYLDVLKMSNENLAKQLKVSKKEIDDIVDEKKSIDINMALRLSILFGTTVELWINLQTKHDLWKIINDEKQNFGEIKPLF